MPVYSASRVTHLTPDYRVAMENRRAICDARGYCGPFVNQAYYDAFPDPMWRGTGECTICCSTCNVEREEAKRREIEAVSVPIRPLRNPGILDRDTISATA